MKGNLAALAVATVISALAITGVVFYGVVNKAHAVTKGIEERNIVESENQLNRLIEMGMEQAALHSTYQAAYNVSKYGTYQHGAYDTFGKCGVSLIDPALLNKLPKTLPYWRILSTACFDTTNFPSTPSEIEDKVIKPWLEKEISDRFNEYIIAIKNEYDNDVDIPPYTSKIQFSGGETVSFEISTTEEIKYDSENLKLSHPLKKITKTIILPLKRLIDLGVDNFITKVPDPFSEKIEEAHQAMVSVTVKDMMNANTNSVKPAYVNNDLNDGELTDITTKNCKSTEYKICINPDIIPDFKYTYPPKSDLLPTNCEAKFKTKSTSNIDALDKVVGDTDFSIKPKFIETKVDLDADNPIVCPTSNVANSDSCDCLSWVCPSARQVKVGDTTKKVPKGQEPKVGTGPKQPAVTCTTCFEIDGDDCIQYSDKVCVQGTPQNGNCLVQTTPTCAAGGTLNGDVDRCEIAPTCSSGTYDTEMDSCITGQVGMCPNGFSVIPGTCTTVQPVTCKCSGSASCPAGTLNIAIDICQSIPTCNTGTYNSETDKCEDTVSKQCPSGTTEYIDPILGNTGRCYNTPTNSPVCGLHKTLYTKTCSYNYQANVAVLVNVADKNNKYPVYDSVEEKNDLRNLELQFYVLSKN